MILSEEVRKTVSPALTKPSRLPPSCPSLQYPILSNSASFIIGLLILILPLVSFSQTKEITLEKAIQLAINNNKEMKQIVLLALLGLSTQTTNAVHLTQHSLELKAGAATTKSVKTIVKAKKTKATDSSESESDDESTCRTEAEKDASKSEKKANKDAAKEAKSVAEQAVATAKRATEAAKKATLASTDNAKKAEEQAKILVEKAAKAELLEMKQKSKVISKDKSEHEVAW